MTDVPPPNQEGSSLTVSDCFEILSLRRRRTILACLAAQPDDAIGFQGLVDAVARRESDLGDESPAGPAARFQERTPRRQRVAIALHHEDLPRLAAAGLVEYDRWRGNVQYDRDDRIDALLACTEQSERQRHDQDSDRERHPPQP